MRVLILGAGDAFTTTGFGSSALIESGGSYVLLDCPGLVHRALAEATRAAGWNVDASSIDDILLTHLHGDHVNGLEAVGFGRMILRMERPEAPRPRVFVNRPAGDRLWERLAPAMEQQRWLDRPSRLDDYFELRPIDTGEVVRVGPLEVRARRTDHPVPATGFLIGDGSWTLGWSGDTTFEREHVDWLSAADLIVHECGPGPVHTGLDQLGALPDELRARLRLTHLPDGFDTSASDMAALAAGDVLTRP